MPKQAVNDDGFFSPHLLQCSVSDLTFRPHRTLLEEPSNKGDWECFPFVRINRLGRPLNNGEGFSKISKPTERNGSYHLHFDFP